MNIQIMEPMKLNAATFFCPQCGISPRPAEGEQCRTCVRKADGSGFGTVLRVKIAGVLRRAADIVHRQ